jgi:hypothetical protein
MGQETLAQGKVLEVSLASPDPLNPTNPRWQRVRRVSFYRRAKVKVGVRQRPNPSPATKIPRVVKRLRAALRGGVCVFNTRGSTVEATWAEVLHIAA